MRIGIVGGGINGLCCAWQLAQQGHQVRLFERGKLLHATSRASSKLLHGGLRYLENGEYRLVREALRERDAWIQRAENLAKPLRLVMPLYKGGRRGRLKVAAGLFLYDHLGGKSFLPGARWLKPEHILDRAPKIKDKGLLGGYEFSDGQMDDYALGSWVAEKARQSGVEILEDIQVSRLDTSGVITTAAGDTLNHDRVINAAGPWAKHLLDRSGVTTPYELDLVRGSHIVLAEPCPQAFFLEVPNERRIFFVLPWKGQTMLGTTEVRQTLDEPIVCSDAEREYLLKAYLHYFPSSKPEVVHTFAGLRPLLYSAQDPNKATREYAIHRTGRLVNVLGGKWTTAMALANKVSTVIQ